MSDNLYQLWGGVHSSQNDDVILFTSKSDTEKSMPPESAIVHFDILLNKAHAKGLRSAGQLNATEYEKLITELDKLLSAHKVGKFDFDSKYEDIHTQIEHHLTQILGDTGKKIHTARSRNDQVTTDMFMFSRALSEEFQTQLTEFSNVLTVSSKKYSKTICPGYTHHQPATVTSFGAILDAFNKMIARDLTKMKNNDEVYDFSPLGAGNGYRSLIPSGNEISAKELGFVKTYENSIDVITNRGEREATLASDIEMTVNHLATISQTLILFSTREFGYLSLADGYTTGSSIMPQKKNPDVLEIVKGKAIIIGGLAQSLRALGRANFIGYNRESQYSKKLIVEIAREIQDIPAMLSGVIKTLKVHEDTMKAACSRGFVTSTGLMELLVIEKNVPMRDAKQLIETAIREARKKGNEDTIDLESYNIAAKNIKQFVEIDAITLQKWQDPDYQFKLIQHHGRP